MLVRVLADLRHEGLELGARERLQVLAGDVRHLRVEMRVLPGVRSARSSQTLCRRFTYQRLLERGHLRLQRIRVERSLVRYLRVAQER